MLDGPCCCCCGAEEDRSDDDEEGELRCICVSVKHRGSTLLGILLADEDLVGSPVVAAVESAMVVVVDDDDVDESASAPVLSSRLKLEPEEWLY
jgi:hypothetical protein